MTNEVLHQVANKPPTSASVYKMYDSDDEATVGMDAELATPSSLSPKITYKPFFILSISVFQISVVIISFVNALQEKFGIGVSVPKPLFHNFSFKKTLTIHQFYIHAIAVVVIFFPAYFLKESCGIGVLVRKPLFHNFLLNKTPSSPISC